MLAAIILGTVMLFANKWVKKIMQVFGLKQKAFKKSIFFSAFLGVWLHVFLDSLLYADVQPLYPLTTNPLYIGLQAFTPVYGLCTLGFVLGFIMYVHRLQKR